MLPLLRFVPSLVLLAIAITVGIRSVRATPSYIDGELDPVAETRAHRLEMQCYGWAVAAVLTAWCV